MNELFWSVRQIVSQTSLLFVSRGKDETLKSMLEVLLKMQMSDPVRDPGVMATRVHMPKSLCYNCQFPVTYVQYVSTSFYILNTLGKHDRAPY